MAQFKLSLGKTTEEQFLKDTLTALENKRNVKN